MRTIYIDDYTAQCDYNWIVDYLREMPTIYSKKDRIRYVKCGCGFDIETSRIDWKCNGETVSAQYCYHWSMGIGDKIIAGRWLCSMEKLFKYLSAALKEMNRTLMILDANLGYEFQHCKHQWQRIGLSKIFAKERRNPLKLNVGESLEFREVIGLFGHSLKDIAKNYCKTQKAIGDLDYSLLRHSTTPLTETEIGYTEVDVKILVELGDYIFRNYFGNNDSLPLTATGFIRNKIKKRIGGSIKSVKAEMQSWLPDEFLYNDFRKYLFKGGICGTNIIYTNAVQKNVVCADLTSDYPACMLHQVFPMGKPVEIPPAAFMKRDNTPFIGLIHFKNVRSKSSHSLMSAHKAMNRNELYQHIAACDGLVTLDNGRIYKAPDLELYLNDVEFKAFCKAYDFDEEASVILRAWRFPKYAKLPRYILDVLEEQYRIKEHLKSTGQKKTQEYKDSKAFVNGIFGMMCTSIYTEIYEFDQFGNIIEEVDEEGNIISKSFAEATKSMFLSPFWGYWVTSYARYILMDIITKFPECILQYDTDSIYYFKDHKKAPELESYIAEYNERIHSQNDVLFDGDPHFRTLGDWEIEKPYPHFKGLGAKRYVHDEVNPDGSVNFVQVICGCRAGTLMQQLKDNNQRDGTNLSPFDFFSDQMVIDKDHTRKLTSKYIDGYAVIYNAEEDDANFMPISLSSTDRPEEMDLFFAEALNIKVTDYTGISNTITIESGIVLEPAEFRMSVKLHHDLYWTLKSMYRNEPQLKNEIRDILDFYEGDIYGKD